MSTPNEEKLVELLLGLLPKTERAEIVFEAIQDATSELNDRLAKLAYFMSMFPFDQVIEIYDGIPDDRRHIRMTKANLNAAKQIKPILDALMKAQVENIVEGNREPSTGTVHKDPQDPVSDGDRQRTDGT